MSLQPCQSPIKCALSHIHTHTVYAAMCVYVLAIQNDNVMYQCRPTTCNLLQYLQCMCGAVCMEECVWNSVCGAMCVERLLSLHDCVCCVSCVASGGSGLQLCF